jgi:hypothetical protein
LATERYADPQACSVCGTGGTFTLLRMPENRICVFQKPYAVRSQRIRRAKRILLSL